MIELSRRGFLACAAGALASPLAALRGAVRGVPVKLGVDLFSLRSQKWTPIEALDYCSKLGAQVVHFSEIRFIGSLDPDNLKRVRQHARGLNIDVEIGMRSICPTSKMFDASAGTAQEQLSRMIDAAAMVGSPIVRAVLGSADDRKTGLERHITDTVAVLRSVRSRAMDAGIRIAIENHAGDMQGWELKNLIETAGREFVGACLDSGNPCWTLEDPMVTLESLAPYVLTSHVRDSQLWLTPEGIAVSWVRMGEGNVGIDRFVKRFVELCPNHTLSMECIVFGPRIFPYKDARFWDDYRDIPAWEFERLVTIAGNGSPIPPQPFDGPNQAARERADLEASIQATRRMLS